MGDASCLVEDCGQPGYVRRFCTRHYQRWLKYGDPEHPQQPRGVPPQPRATPTSQVCTKCGELKPAAGFRKASARPSGISAACRLCLSRYYAARKAARLEEHRATQRRWARRKRTENPEAYKEENRRRYAKRAEYVKAKTRRWQREHPSEVAAREAQRRSQIAGTRAGVVDLNSLWTGHCALCAEPLDRDLPWPDQMSKSIDHITPLAKGGTHTQDNLQWTHLICNIRKGARI